MGDEDYFNISEFICDEAVLGEVEVWVDSAVEHDLELFFEDDKKAGSSIFMQTQHLFEQQLHYLIFIPYTLKIINIAA